MNLNPGTRKDQILKYLLDRKGDWVDGTRLATEEVGGSEGLRRLRELRSDAYTIEQRRHPDPNRSIWQYRIVDKQVRQITDVELFETSITKDEMPWGPITPLRDNAQPVRDEPKKLEFGLNALCHACEGSGRKHGGPCQICGGRGWN